MRAGMKWISIALTVGMLTQAVPLTYADSAGTETAGELVQEAESAPEDTESGKAAAEAESAPKDTDSGEAAAEAESAPEDTDSGEAAADAESALEDVDSGEAAADAEGEKEQAEWTVMLYLCGTDLESEGGMATKNLEMIAKTAADSHVNLLIETGGASQWKAKETVGIDISSDALQRWVYSEDGFSLVDETENTSMARYSTLSDFIKWGSENYPAKKHMLILWDHGGGSSSGIICDELYDFAAMSLDGVSRALREGGTHFDLLMTDACLMANIETAQAVQPYADYLLASEEVVPGLGTNYREWLQTLYDEPDCSAVRLGRIVCDATQILYAEGEDAVSANGLTFSVIDLGRIGEVAEAFENFMKEAIGLIDDPYAFGLYVNAVSSTDRYMLRSMWDLYDLARRSVNGGISKETALRLENAVDSAVIFNIRGSYHPYSHGLSAYLQYNGKQSELDRLARSCRNPWQLAFLDAVSPKWDAPDWVIDTVGYIPELNSEDYKAKFSAEVPEDQGAPVLHIYSGIPIGAYVRYELQRFDDDMKLWYTLGESEYVKMLRDDDEEVALQANFTGKWPAIDGEFLHMSSLGELDRYVLMQASVLIPDWAIEDVKLRILAEYPPEYYDMPPEEDDDDDAESSSSDASEQPLEELSEEEEEEESEVVYSISGVWDGFDSSTGLPNRNTVSLYSLQGMDMKICSALYSNYRKDIGDLRYSDPIPITSSLEVLDEDLPEGKYRLRYSISDMLDTSYTTDFFDFTWDGEQAVFEPSDNLDEDTEDPGLEDQDEAA